jgi:Fe-S cluster assembly protein SufD
MTAAVQHAGVWLDHFAAQQPQARWIEELRGSAFERFTELGFPTAHDEEWRFTNVAPIARTAFVPAAPATTPNVDALVPYAEGIRLVFVNGWLVERTAGPCKGLEAGLLTEQAVPHLDQYAPGNAFAALNTAFLDQAALVRVARGAVVKPAIHLVYLTAPGAAPVVTHPRTLVVVEAGAQCTVVESYAGTGAYFTNAVTEVVAGEGAVVDHYKVQNESPAAFHVATLQAALGRSANFASCSISLGAALARNDIGAALSEGADAVLDGLYLAGGTQHVDHHTTIDHARPHATSRELYKGILDGRASAVFNGKVLVRKDAQKTDSRQTNQNLLLSAEAVIDTKPELEIFADDVRCTHGATIGQLDAESLFYLQSRGIGKQQARSLLTFAFAQDIVDRIKIQSLKNSLERVLLEKFHGHGH